MKSYLKTAAILFLSLYFSNEGADASIIINEAMIDPEAASETNGEWIELYNDGTENIDINQWILKDAGTNYHEISGGTLIIPAKGYLVLGRNGIFADNGGYIPDYVYTNFGLANTGDDEILIGATEEAVAGISYDIASWQIEPGRSMAYDGDGDITDPANWFATAQESQYIYGAGDYGTPGEANFPIAPEPATVLLLASGILMLGKRLKRGKVNSR